MVKTYFVMYYDKCYKVCFHSNKHENFLRFETNVDSLEENISELVFLFYVFCKFGFSTIFYYQEKGYDVGFSGRSAVCVLYV